MRKITDEKKWNIAANVVSIIFCASVMLPFLLLLIASFTDNNWATVNGFSFFPQEWSLGAYKYILHKWKVIGHGYLMTIIVTIIGTVVSVVITSMYAWGIADEKLPGAKILNILTILTMLFSGGIVANYFVWTNVFEIRDTIWALILPNCLMNGFNIILVKNYYKCSIPKEMVEAARIDGASEIGLFWRIVFPLALPITITVGLMTALRYWNDWINGLYYLTQRDGSKYYTIQLILNQINENIAFLSQNADNAGTINITDIPSTTARMAIAIVGVLPIMVIYPFFQKYFVKGITLGGVKG